MPMMGGSGIVRAPESSLSAEASQFLARLPNAPDSTHETAYIALIDGLVADSVWSKLDALYILAAETAGNAAVNLKSSSYGLSLVSTPTFTADQGYVGSAGSGQALDTQLVLTSASQYSPNSGHVGIYNRSNRAANSGFTFGVLGANVRYLNAKLRNAVDNLEYDINTTAFPTVSNANSHGMFVVSRTGASALEVYRNGSSLGTDTDAAAGVPTTYSVYILTLNNQGTPHSNSVADQIAAFSVGAGLNGSEAATLSSRINTYMAALGTNVY